MKNFSFRQKHCFRHPCGNDAPVNNAYRHYKC